MKILVSAPFHGPRFEGTQLVAAATRIGLDVIPFEHPASRDPTIELPELVRRERPGLVLIVAPSREDPDTFDLARGFGAVVAAWFPSPPAGSPAWKKARMRWIAAAADRVFATTERTADGLSDRLGRAAAVLRPGFDAATIGAVGNTAVVPSGASDGPAVAVRGADDPLFLDRATRREEFRGHGDRAAFRGLPFGGRLDTPKEFGELTRGRRYIAGGRVDDLPTIFDDAAAARACGARVLEVGVRGKVADAIDRSTGDACASDGGFAAALRSIVEAAVGR